jgi:voltage-gated potassium channel Kch
MISFFINVLKLIQSLFYGIKEDQEFRILLLLLVTLLIGSTLFYSQVEGWSKIDALYFSVMTMSTIGYGDLVPTTTLSKIFTIIFAFLSVGVFVGINTKIVLIALNRNKKKLSQRRTKKRSQSPSQEERIPSDD